MKIHKSTIVDNSTKQCIVFGPQGGKVVIRYMVENNRVKITWTSRDIPNDATSYLQAYLSGREFC